MLNNVRWITTRQASNPKAPEPGPTPEEMELLRAQVTSIMVVKRLQGLHGDAAAQRFPTAHLNITMAVFTADTLQTLRDEHGGLLPNEFFRNRGKHQCTLPDQEQHAFHEYVTPVYDPHYTTAQLCWPYREALTRWSDWDGLWCEFPALEFSRDEFQCLAKIRAEGRAEQIVECLRGWLRTHKIDLAQWRDGRGRTLPTNHRGLFN